MNAGEKELRERIKLDDGAIRLKPSELASIDSEIREKDARIAELETKLEVAERKSSKEIDRRRLSDRRYHNDPKFHAFVHTLAAFARDQGYDGIDLLSVSEYAAELVDRGARSGREEEVL